MGIAFGVVLAFASLTLAPLVAEAGGDRSRVGGGVRHDFHGTGGRNHSGFHGLPAGGRSGFHGGHGDRSRRHVHPGHGHHGHTRFHHGPKVLVFPTPIYVTPSPCWTPGYWSYQWVPVTYAYNTWIPGQWSPEGTWIEGHYAARPYTTGSYQPYWVEGYWRAC